jgi:hypothetical protein
MVCWDYSNILVLDDAVSLCPEDVVIADFVMGADQCFLRIAILFLFSFP